tara:strand:+ start:254 stop:445 length:192 start_codon:yes stop_codon:yes gene_type:complete
MVRIIRVTKLQKEIINQILEDGLNAYYYDQDFVDDRAFKFSVDEYVIRMCIEYVEDKFKFWKV